MIVDIFVPYMGVSFDFKLDETAVISSVIEEIATTICTKERWPTPASAKDLDLFDPVRRRRLSRENCLAEEGIQTGYRLILC